MTGNHLRSIQVKTVMDKTIYLAFQQALPHHAHRHVACRNHCEHRNGHYHPMDEPAPLRIDEMLALEPQQEHAESSGHSNENRVNEIK